MVLPATTSFGGGPDRVASSLTHVPDGDGLQLLDRSRRTAAGLPPAHCHDDQDDQRGELRQHRDKLWWVADALEAHTEGST